MIRQLLTRAFGRSTVLGRYFIDLIRIDARDPVRRHVVASQVDATTRTLRHLIVPAGIVVPGLVIMLHPMAHLAIMLCGAGIILLASGAAIRMFPVRADPASPRVVARGHVIVATLLGCGWSILASSFDGAKHDDVLLVAISMQTALIAVGMVLYLNLPAAFLAFSGTLALNFVIQLLSLGTSAATAAAPMIVIFFLIMARAAIDQSRLYVDHALATHRMLEAEAERHATTQLHAEERLALTRRETEAAEATRARRHAEMLELADQFEATVVTVVRSQAGAAHRLEQSARMLSAMTERAKASAEASLNRANTTSDAVVTLAVATADLLEAIERIGQRVADHAEVSTRARSRVFDSEARIKAMADEAGRAEAVVALISDVTAQTNLLALNAAIEASRAGEAGRGFAVVAGEVKSLASRAGAASRDVATQIEAIGERAEGAADAIRSTAGEIQQVAEIAIAIAQSIAQQRTATENISREAETVAANAEQARGGLSAMVDGARRAVGVTDDVAATASALAADATELDRATRRFLDHLRAA